MPLLPWLLPHFMCFRVVLFFAPIMPLIVLLFHFIFTPPVIWLKWVPCSAQPLVIFLGYCAPRCFANVDWLIIFMACCTLPLQVNCFLYAGSLFCIYLMHCLMFVIYIFIIIYIFISPLLFMGFCFVCFFTLFVCAIADNLS